MFKTLQCFKHKHLYSFVIYIFVFNLYYTLWSIKKGHYIIGDNFVKCEPIFTTFALLRRK